MYLLVILNRFFFCNFKESRGDNLQPADLANAIVSSRRRGRTSNIRSLTERNASAAKQRKNYNAADISTEVY